MNTAGSSPRPPASRIDTVVVALYVVSIAAMAWCYFAVPAPERWRFVLQALRGWADVFLSS